MSWHDVAGRSEPVRGDPALFDLAHQRWITAAGTADRASGAFRRILRTDGPIQGQAAVAFAAIVRECQAVLDDVPIVCRDIAFVMENHAKQLRAFRQAADRALARAEAAWSGRSAAQRSRDQHAATVRAVQNQIRQLTQQPSPDPGRQLALDVQLKAAQGAMVSALTSRDSAQRSLDAELRKWDELAQSERDLNERTAGQLDDIDLRSLRDKAWLERQWTGVTDFVQRFGDNIEQMIAAFAAGNLEEAFWKLRDVIEQLVTVLEVVAIVAAVVVLAVAVVASGGSLLAALPVVLPALMQVANAFAFVKLMLSSAKLTAGIALMSDGSVNPETGLPMSYTELGFDALDVGTSLVVAGKGASAFHGSGNLAGYNSGRVLLDKELHVVLSSGYKHSAGQTAGALTEHAVEGQLRGLGETVWTTNEAMLRGDSPWVDPRLAAVHRDLDAVVSQYPGLTSPVNMVVVGTY